MFGWSATAAAGECPTVEARVVGVDPAGARVLVRLESRVVADEAADPEGPARPPSPPAITLRALDVPSGAVAGEWVVLRPEDRGDAGVRAKNWARAEAEAAALGLAITPDRRPLWDAGLQCANDPVPLRVGAAEVTATEWRPTGQGGGVGLRLARRGAAETRTVLDWPAGAPPLAQACLRSVWAVPGDRAVVAVAQRPCAEPKVDVVPLGP